LGLCWILLYVFWAWSRGQIGSGPGRYRFLIDGDARGLERLSSLMYAGGQLLESFAERRAIEMIGPPNHPIQQRPDVLWACG
jgi:hypothetical protein